MIEQHFSMLSGIGPKRRRAIEDAGVTDWEQFVRLTHLPGLPDSTFLSLRQQLLVWSDALQRKDAVFFNRHLPRAEHWLLFETFADSIRYLDIETTGLSPAWHDVTVVGICDGREHVTLVKDQGLTAAAIMDALGDCKLLVTYYGSQFDVPFLQAAFPGTRWNFPHYDLCFAGRRVGLTGGLKAVERTLGLARDDAIVDVDGYEAVRLWRAYRRGDLGALATLIEYNEADTRNLASIATLIYERLSQPPQRERPWCARSARSPQRLAGPQEGRTLSRRAGR